MESNRNGLPARQFDGQMAPCISKPTLYAWLSRFERRRHGVPTAQIISWGIVAPSADVVATLTEYPEGAVIYVYEPGDTLFDNSIAAGLWVGFFLEDDNETGTPNLMTEEGLQLFAAAVAFSLGTTVPVRRG